MRVIKRNIEKVWGARYTLGARYLYIIRDAEKVCGARYTLGARYLPKNTVVHYFFIFIKENASELYISMLKSILSSTPSTEFCHLKKEKGIYICLLIMAMKMSNYLAFFLM
jgi:hypothetical protein